ncbi:MAG: response regulator [Calditrichaeota bacterium]|nr:MAG: response regulator [Calditrichota bacterium]
MRRAELNNALERKNFEAQKLKEVDEMKSRFFADISHEFRTPLTLILGPFEKVLAGIKDKDERNDLHVMRRNALRLQRLVEQLLDLSRIEAHRMPLHAQFVDIVTHIKEWTAAFVSLAESQDIRFDLKLPKEDLPVYVDVEKIEKVVFNLLSNAFKFTPESGEISVTVCKKSWDVNPDRVLNPVRIVASDCLSITVSDSGIGIPPDQLSHIFDRFYRASDALAGEQRGTGIGLALVKELVELHHGEIRVESEPGKGSSFTMLLPLGRDHLTNDEIIDPAGADTKQEFRANVPKSTTDSLSQKEISSPTKPTSTLTPSTSGGRILVVEDNEDMRRYLRNALKQNFVISEAGNGEKGFQAALKKNPDLIISDVMMPVMGGFALCEKLKTDARTSHIPVILLTARAGQGDKLEGLEIGADDYLTKPFDTLELHIRVKNLIAQRRRLRELFTRNILIQPSQITATSIDEEFLQRAMDIVEKYIADSTFQIEQFCREISMSQSTLNRKLHALTGSSANGFIRSMRLKRASQLLQQKSATIVEIAYQVGFNNPSYFAQCFREQFGVAPSDYSASPENSKI